MAADTAALNCVSLSYANVRKRQQASALSTSAGKASIELLAQRVRGGPETVGQCQHAHRDAGQTRPQQRASAQLVDQCHRNNREHEVDDADQHRLHERRIRADARLFEDHRRVEEHRIDARQLLQDGNRNTDGHDELHGRLEQLPDSNPLLGLFCRQTLL